MGILTGAHSLGLQLDLPLQPPYMHISSSGRGPSSWASLNAHRAQLAVELACYIFIKPRQLQMSPFNILSNSSSLDPNQQQHSTNPTTSSQSSRPFLCSEAIIINICNKQPSTSLHCLLVSQATSSSLSFRSTILGILPKNSSKFKQRFLVPELSLALKLTANRTSPTSIGMAV